jgi:thiosulfate dehydrogenase
MRRALIYLSVLVVGVGLGYILHRPPPEQDCYFRRSLKHQFVVAQARSLVGFNLVDPEQAPPEIRDSVMRGYRLFTHTGFYAPHYVGNELSCSNCHFCGGDTVGGKNGGISLVGVTTLYPQYSKRSGTVIDLTQRINNCFQRSLNGKAPPADSLEIQDLLTYLKWISKEVEQVKNIPWLGLPTLKTKHKPDPHQGQQVYTQYCAACHQDDGQGGGTIDPTYGKTIPPLWGPHSFNDGAGMSTIEMLAPFVYLNMPFQQASLSEEQALDVASFVLQQPRPHFKKQ